MNEVNAHIFEQLAMEAEYMAAAHELAEYQVEAFKVGHATIRSLGYALYKAPDQQMAFSLGATIYEALATTVRPIDSDTTSKRKMHFKTASILSLRDDSASAVMEILDEEERLQGETPRVSGLFDSAAQFYPDLDRRLIRWGQHSR